MFDKLLHKGMKMAGNYVKDQMSQRAGQQRNTADPQNQAGYGQPADYRSPNRPQAQGTDADRAAIAKYKYMLRTAPPEDMERAHAEAFSRLTPQQRSMLQAELAGHLPVAERPRSDRPEDLARAATRAEVSQPGFMERTLGRGSGSGMGGALAAGAAGGLGAGLLAGVAGAFIGSAIAGPLLEGFSDIGDGIAGAADGLGDNVTAAGEDLSAAGDEVTGQAGGLFDGFGDTGGAGGDWEL
ncbi:hypothetical protein HGG74_19845 [Arthrobacter sp. E918]|uniref:Cation-transporting ATPase n=2 Tax=Arthrobacter mobilis TaxID=2724944 RepID=A0A7X6K7S3_9MICC|nr:hypothetical protein [Arthrobacter mobilis]